ncbi:ATP synthase F1 subunit gamma [Candidatus Azambacteria bacterium]|nr:ATP synthase F1 subunit gamma [Candidatus Azambacteria bacterium]
MSLKSIKNKIRSVQKTKQVTKAMESVSAVKMRKSQKAALDTRHYAMHAFNILKRVSGSIDGKGHFFMEERDVKKTCLFVITSDKGLAGSLNSAVIKSIVREMAKNGLNKDNSGFILIGRKGYEYFSKRGYKIERYYEKLGDDAPIDLLKDASDLMAKLYENKEYDKFDIFYTDFISTTEQEAISRTVLPIKYEEVKKTIDGILPKTGKYSKVRDLKIENTEDVKLYLFEPGAKEILKELLPFLLNIQVYYSFLEAKASEHSARMVAMKNASDKADELSRDLKLIFNKARQAAITKEISEITGGIEAMVK